MVEAADTSPAYDRSRKPPLYAAADIPGVWIMNLNADEVEIYSEPKSGGYAGSARVKRGDRVVSETLPDFVFDAEAALPPEPREVRPEI